MVELSEEPQRARLRETLAELGLDQELVDLVVDLSPCRAETDLMIQTFVTSN